MILYNFISSLLWFVVSFEIWILERLGYKVSVFGETDKVPWFVEWPLWIWIAVAMFISIIIMVRQSARLTKNLHNILIQSS